MSGVSKMTADRNQRILLDLVNKPGNDICADCKARTPRWASHNLGIFLCMNCASIHRKIGTHITKVKSVTMDSWTNEQVEVMKSVGNVMSNAKYNPNVIRHPPPTNREESERDSELEKFIRHKYEFKRFMEKPSSKPSHPSLAPPGRAQSTPATKVARKPSPPPPAAASHISNRAPPPSSQVVRPISASPASSHPQPSVPFTPSVPPATVRSSTNTVATNPVWEDIMSLAGPSASSITRPPQPAFTSPAPSGNPYATLSPTMTFPSISAERSPNRSASLPIAPTYVQPQSRQPSVGNPFGMTQQPSSFTGQVMSASFQQATLQGQTPFVQSQFTPLSQPPFPQAGQTAFSHSYTPPSAVSQVQLQQQFAPSSLPQAQVHGYQQQQLAQSGNPFGIWSQQQPSFPGQQQQLGTFVQTTGFVSQQQHGQWNNM